MSFQLKLCPLLLEAFLLSFEDKGHKFRKKCFIRLKSKAKQTRDADFLRPIFFCAHPLMNCIECKFQMSTVNFVSSYW